MIAAFLLGAVLSQAPADAPRAAPSSPLSVYVRGGLHLYLSDAQTAGGIGGGLGARYAFSGERFFAQADVSRLVMIGNPTLVRVGAGAQRRGTWAPAATLSASAFLGDRLRFLTGERMTPARLPAVALGVNVTPLRWVSGTSEVSLLELGAGLGWDFPGRGTALNVGLVEVAIRL